MHDSTADIRYFVRPLRPAGSENWRAAELEKLVTRDSLIGVMDALPATPPEREKFFTSSTKGRRILQKSTTGACS